MLRHSVIWLLRDTTTQELRVEMLKGLAYLRMECPMVRCGDYGADIFGGARWLHDVPQAERTPVWRRGAAGPPSNYDVALHLDFDDWAGHEQYNADPAHAAASRFNESSRGTSSPRASTGTTTEGRRPAGGTSNTWPCSFGRTVRRRTRGSGRSTP